MVIKVVEYEEFTLLSFDDGGHAVLTGDGMLSF
jgi:hypothetical protein